MNKRWVLVFVAAMGFGPASFAEPFLSVELGPTWQSRNDVGIPSSGGTRFSLMDAGAGPFFAWRMYAGYAFDERHEVRLLIAPLTASGRGTYTQNLSFANQTFTAGTPIDTTYKFNSYRLTYRYAFYLSDSWRLQVGLTGKIRDARVALQQGALSAESTNVGFVPLLNFAARYKIDEDWALLLDIDGLAAPQGRAVDATIQVSRKVVPWMEAQLGYRTLEGGAENTTIYSFAWLHYLTLGASFTLF